MIRVLGIDPGPDSSAWADLEVKDLDECPYDECRFTVVSAEEVKSITGSMRSALIHGCNIVAVESCEGMAFAPFRVPSLLQTSEVAGGWKHVAEFLDLRTMALSGRTWRAALCVKRDGKGIANASNAIIRIAVEDLTGYTSGNAHKYDAIGVAIVAACRLLYLNVPMLSDDAQDAIEAQLAEENAKRTAKRRAKKARKAGAAA